MAAAAAVKKRLVPLLNRILVRKDEPITKTKSGVLVAENPQKSKISRGTVIAVGPGITNEQGKQIPLSIKVGDRVVLPDYGGMKLKYDENTDYFLYRETDILAKVADK